MGLLTNAAIKAAKPNGKQQTLNDGLGLQLRISHSGNSLTWFYQYRHPVTKEKRRVEYGSYPQLSLTDARSIHLATKGLIKQGIDPLEQRDQQRLEADHRRLELEREKNKQENTIEALAWRWFNNYIIRSRRRPEYMKRMIEVDIVPPLGKLVAAEAGRSQLVGAIEDIISRGSPGQAREVLAAIKQMFNYGEQVGIIDVSPIANIKASMLVGKRKPRERFLTLEEIRAVWLELPNTGLTKHTILAIKLLLITGQRRGELMSARWEHIDWEAQTWTIPQTKNNKSHTVPLSPLAEKLFLELESLSDGSPWCFPGKDGKHITEKSITRAVGRKQENFKVNDKSLPHWTPHDLRRTAMTQMLSLGVPPHVAELATNHTISTGVSDVFGVYARYDYQTEIRQAMNQWAERIESLFAGDKVVPLPIAKRS